MKSKKIVSIALSALTSAYLYNTLILNRLNIQSENNIYWLQDNYKLFIFKTSN